eukprot:s3230_g4.t1
MQDEVQLQPHDLPSLTDLERSFRRVKSGKAVGEDCIPPELCRLYPVQMARMVYGQLLKLCVRGQEALLHKGGTLIAAWKRKGPQHCCESYRSLLISSHVAKSVHRAVRDHQATIYESFLQSEQIGGRRHVPVTMGVHYIRAAARVARRLKKSHAMIFLDLREAFYRVLRPLSIGGHMPDALLAFVAARLRLPDDAIADLHALLRRPSGTEQANMPRHMRRTLQALHTNTHFKVPGQDDRVHTLIGSRPGDPFADVVFGFMFTRILTAVEERLAEYDLLETFEDSPEPGLFPLNDAAPITHTMMGPTWMDDVCLSISSSSATETVHRAGLAASVLLETCTAHGVTPNLDKGKSEILLSLRGEGSRKLKLQFFSDVQGKCMPIVTEYGTQHISVVGHYTHLGNVAHHSGQYHREIRQRIAIGNKAFNTHRRVIFQNPAFSPTRRAELFMSLVNSKIVYAMDSWVFDDNRTRDYFHSAMIRLYRRLLKLKPDSSWSDDEVLAQVHLPSADILLRVARLRYLGLLYKCEEVTPWAALRADVQWSALVRSDLQWLWSKISRTCKLRDPDRHFGEWEYILRYHRSYWKTLIQRGVAIHKFKLQDQLLLRKLHRDVFVHFEQFGTFDNAPTRPDIPVERQHEHFGCMLCKKRCRTRAGEGAHMFRKHGVVALERHWISGTHCESCLKEFHTYDKLQTHLRTARHCRQVLNARPRHPQLVPGKGSTSNARLREQHDGLLPVQHALGPRLPEGPHRDLDLHHVSLFEALALSIYDFSCHDVEGLFDQLHDLIQTHLVSWTTTQLTIHHLIDSFTEDNCTDMHFTHAELHGVLHRLCDVRSWHFLHEVEYETAHGDHLFPLDLYEGWCDALYQGDATWTPTTSQCPRLFFKERVVLHAYSGRRCPGDLQWFLDTLASQHHQAGLLVVSLDLVIDDNWGDIAKSETQLFWLRAIKQGWVLGMLSGPPCCTWSVARGKVDPQLLAAGRHGPRVIRTLAELWGVESVSLREMAQLHDGHVLLGFSLQAWHTRASRRTSRSSSGEHMEIALGTLPPESSRI